MLKTKRLLLRQWKQGDFEAFANLCADKDVMAFFPNTLTRDESFALGNKAKSLIDKHGWGAWAVEIPDQQPFIGFVGLNSCDDNMPCSPCVEIAWRLAKPFWGQGFATEAALEALNYAFHVLQLKEVVAFTTTSNLRSQSVMRKIGMRDSGNNFMHPEIEPGHPQREHVLYKIEQHQWENRVL